MSRIRLTSCLFYGTMPSTIVIFSLKLLLVSMPESAHHFQWLRPINETLESGAPITETERARMASICRDILNQNPASAMASEFLRRLQSVTTNVSSVTTQHEMSKKFDVLTGKLGVFGKIVFGKSALIREALFRPAPFSKVFYYIFSWFYKAVA